MTPHAEAPPLPPVLADEAQRLTRRFALGALTLSTLLALPFAAPVALLGMPLYVEIRRAGAISLPLAAALLCLGAALATLRLTSARPRAAANPETAPEIGRAARIPQALLVPAFCLPAAALAWQLRPAPLPASASPETGFTLAATAVAAAFLLLIAERNLAAIPLRTLPEAAPLRAVALVGTLTAFAAGVLELAANLGLPATATIGTLVALAFTLTATELSARAAGRLFLPPPSPGAAHAAIHSLLARLISAGARPEGGLGAPLRQHLGIDFSRSWALGYLRAASLPMLGAFLLFAWGLSGIALVPLDNRAIYERFGAPVAVLHPGLHLGLPWPLGAGRMLEYGPLHEIGLLSGPGAGGPIERTGAEEPAPPSADRLWEQAHSGEVDLLIASTARLSDNSKRDSFQSVSADLRILYRVGLTDADALHAAYQISAPEDLVRANAGRITAAYFAARTLDQVLGADRAAMAETLRARLQATLDASHSGLDAVAVIIEAVHPPAGAADAYHNVRAAEINARTAVAVEHGAAATVSAQSRQYAFDQTASARATAAETINSAKTAQIRFTADQGAAAAGGHAFLIERYFAALTTALGRAPKTIIDHRLNYPEAPVLDLRPMAPPGIGPAKEE